MTPIGATVATGSGLAGGAFGVAAKAVAGVGITYPIIQAYIKAHEAYSIKSGRDLSRNIDLKMFQAYRR
jgi:hypothetical protein